MVKLADRGDALMATPALRALHSTWPDASIDVLTTPAGAEALAGLSSIDRLVVLEKHQFDQPSGLLSASGLGPLMPVLLDLRRREYDYLLLLHHLTTTFGAVKYRALVRAIGANLSVGLDNGRGGFLDIHVPDHGFGCKHEVDYALDVAEVIGARRGSGQLEITLDGAARRRAEQLLPDGGWLALHVGGGAFSLARRWDPAAFANTAQTLADRHQLRIAVIGTEVERKASEAAIAALSGPAVNLIGQMSFKVTAAALARCRLLLSTDSGVLHMATAVNVPVVGVYGPSNDRAWGPYPPERHRVVRVTLPCSPCIYRGKSLGTPQGCPTRDCLKLVTPDMVTAAAEELLAQIRPLSS